MRKGVRDGENQQVVCNMRDAIRTTLLMQRNAIEKGLLCGDRIAPVDALDIVGNGSRFTSCKMTMLPIDRVTLLFGNDVEVTLALHTHSTKRALPDTPPQLQKHDSAVQYHEYPSSQSTYHLDEHSKAHLQQQEPLPENHRSDRTALLIIRYTGVYSRMSGC